MKARLQISIFKLTRNDACIILVVPVDVSNASPLSRIIYIVPKFYLFLMIIWLLIIKKMSYNYTVKKEVMYSEEWIKFSFCRHTKEALEEFQPDAVVYNAGTDILEGDPLGNLSISAQVRKPLLIGPFCLLIC